MNHEAIVTVNDMMLANETGAIDQADIKTTWLVDDDNRGTSWFCLYAGDPTVYKMLTWHIQSAIGHSPAVSLADMKVAAENAYDAMFCRQIEREVLARQYGIDYAQFAIMGSKKSPGALFEAINKEIPIARKRIESEMFYGTQATSLLIGGFDHLREPHIFSTDALGRCTMSDNPGYYAIGIGAEAARAWLLAMGDKHFPKHNTAEYIIYHLAEAKFLAENSPYVGKTTFVNVWLPDREVLPLFISASNEGRSLQSVRSAWQTRVSAAVDNEALLQIKTELKSHIQVYKTTRPLGAAQDAGIALARFHAIVAGLQDCMKVINATPQDQYSDEIYAELRLHRYIAQKREPELLSMIGEWQSSGVKPSEFASAAGEFEFALVALRNNRYQTIRKPNDDDAKPLQPDPPQTTYPEPSKPSS